MDFVCSDCGKYLYPVINRLTGKIEIEPCDYCKDITEKEVESGKSYAYDEGYEQCKKDNNL